MLKNRVIGKKIRNIVILIMAMVIMIGAYKNIDRSRAEDVIEIGAIALDNYGYLADEEFMLEARKIENDMYEIELPDNINSKKINQIIKVTLEDIDSKTGTQLEETTSESSSTEENSKVEIVEDKIYMTEAQKEEKKLNIEVVYDVAILEEKEDGTINKTLLAEKTEEERKQLEKTGLIGAEGINTEVTTKTLYNKILRYEDEENKKVVEVKGFLPVNAKLQVEEVSQQQLTKIFGETKIDVAYDIKLLVEVVTTIPADEADPTAKPQEIVETIEIDPADFGETCEVTITDAIIEKDTKVYHVKEDNTYEKVNIKENEEGNVSFEAPSFSVYALSNEGVMLTELDGETKLFYSTTSEDGPWTEVSVSSENSKENPAEVKANADGEIWVYAANDSATKICIKWEDAGGNERKEYRDVGIDGKIKLYNGTYGFFGADEFYGTEEETLTEESNSAWLTVKNAPKVDIVAPIAGTLIMKELNENGEDYASPSWTNKSVYIEKIDGYDSPETIQSLCTGHKSTTYSIVKDGEEIATDQVNSRILTETGVYEIIVLTEDNYNHNVIRTYTIRIDKEKPTIAMENVNIDVESHSVTVDLIAIDNYSGIAGNMLNSDNIDVYIDGEKVDSWIVETMGETKLTLSGLEENFKRTGKNYKEWSGNIEIVIKEGSLIDNIGMTSDEKTFSLGHVDTIAPELEYKYYEADINQKLENVKIVFTITDKYFDETNTEDLKIENLNIWVNDEIPEKSKCEISSIKNVYGTVNGTEKIVGKEYTLIISELDQKEIAEGDKYANYSGIVTIVVPGGNVKDTSQNVNTAQTLTIGVSKILEEKDPDEIGGTEEYVSKPYIPEGYAQVIGTSQENGYVIEDEKGNQYVWIDVPKTENVYKTAGLDITTFTDVDYARIENDLRTYSTTYRNSTIYSDEYYSDETTGFEGQEYNVQEKRMLKSIYLNGGFYIGRYETGYAYDDANGIRTSSTTTTEQTPVIKANSYPYNYVTTVQAQELAESFATEGLSTSLMYGVQWDLVLKHLENKGILQSDLNTNSTNLGNYNNSTYNVDTNKSALYSIDSGNTWQESPYNKTSSGNYLWTTGATDEFAIKNIYDLAGNINEWTLEYSANANTPTVYRGGSFSNDGSTIPVSSRNCIESGSISAEIGFRVALYKDEGISRTDITKPAYTLEEEGYTHVEGTTMDNGYVIEDSKGNQWVWVEVPRTSDVYLTAGTKITQFTSTDLKRIEEDLAKYSDIYNDAVEHDYADEMVWDTTDGVTSGWSDYWGQVHLEHDNYGIPISKTEFDIQKEKILKSIYLNEGFYIGRYEVGLHPDDPDRTEGVAKINGNDLSTGATAPTETPVIQKDRRVFRYIYAKQAQELSKSFTSGTDKYISTLPYSLQFDLTLRYLENKGATQAELITESGANWGHVTEKYVINTGSNEKYKKQNIYDLAGNLREYTLARATTKAEGAVQERATMLRGSIYDTTKVTEEPDPSNFIPSGGVNWPLSWAYAQAGFRPILFKDDGANVPAYIPEGYTHVETVDGGYVIEDAKGNQFIWIDVPKTTTLYTTAGLNITEFTDAEYTKIETDLKKYATSYLDTNYVDSYYSDATTGLTDDQYSVQKKKMLKSIYLNGGFYVGRYETGIDSSQTARTEAGDTTQTPVIKANATPYNFVTAGQAQVLAESFAQEGSLTSLMFGVQWGLMLKDFETKGTQVSVLNSNSATIGNYGTSSYVATSSNSAYSIKGIYDFAGNVREWTLERYNNSSTPTVAVGGAYSVTGANYPADSRYRYSTTTASEDNGFRVALYKDEGTRASSNIEEPAYIPEGYEHVAGTTMDNGYVVQDASGNQYVWVEVPRTTTVYPNVGTDLTEFSEGEFILIEQDLKTYTSTYRGETVFSDEFYEYETLGLTEAQYNIQKKKMLKSIYINKGFYVGRYETGTETTRTSSSDELTTAVIQKNAYPYNYVTSSQARELATNFSSEGYVANLMFGLQWDLMLKYLEAKGTVQDELTTSSISWGNYTDSAYYLIDPNSKYSTDGGGTWLEGVYDKTASTQALITTGALPRYNIQNIYDLGGNIWEHTMELATQLVDGTYTTSVRGGNYEDSNQNMNQRDSSSINANAGEGFRVALYKDEGSSGTTDGEAVIVDIVKPIWTTENLNVDVENEKLTIDLIVTDKYFGNSSLLPEHITIYQNEDEKIALDHITKTLSGPEELKETREVDNVATVVTYGHKYTLTLTNWAEAKRRTGKMYSEWSGQTSIEIRQGTASDQYTNENIETTLSLGFVDLVKPEFTYEFSETDIDQTSKTVKLVFSVTDKYYKEETDNKLTLEDLTIYFDGVLLGDADRSGTIEADEIFNEDANKNGLLDEGEDTNGNGLLDISPISTLTSVEKRETRTNESGTEESVLIGNTYTLLITNIQQNEITSGNNYLDYSGVVTVVIDDDLVTDESGNLNDSETITIGENIPEEDPDLPCTEYTTPYLPKDYSYVEGDLATGIVIADPNGNEYVWVEVPRTTNVYSEDTLSISLNQLETNETTTEEELTTAYETIESELQTYATTYRHASYKDTYPTDELVQTGLGIENLEEYTDLKRRMLRSVFENGGFYVGRYEAGIEDTFRASADVELTTPVIKQNAYPYIFVTGTQAQALAEGFATEGYETNLMFGLQWDLVMKHLETKAVEQGDTLSTVQNLLKSNSTTWGNYKNNGWTISNANSKYSTNGTSWTSKAYGTKNTSTSVLLSTGASDVFKKQNIYDIAGNVFEWTLEYGNSTSSPVAYRGGIYNQSGGTTYHANFRGTQTAIYSTYLVGFRVALFEDEEIVKEDTVADVVDPLWETENLTINQDEQKVTVDIIVTDKYLKESTLTEDDITLYVDGTDMTSIQYVNKQLSEPEILTETRTIDGADVQVKYGMKYTLTISDWEIERKTSDKIYADWSGATKLVIATGVATDEYENTSQQQEFQLGNIIDVIKPAVTYKYSETDTDYDDKTVKLVFSVTDKYYYEPTAEEIAAGEINRLKLEDLTILIDGELPGDTNGNGVIDGTESHAITRDFTWERIEETRTNADGTGTTYLVGYEYTLLLSDLQKDDIESGKKYLDYSGVITVAIPEGKIKDTVGNENDAETITMGIDIPSSYPYIPTGYEQVVNTNLDTGLVIRSPEGNEYVWVEVPRTTDVYSIETLMIDLDELTGDELTAAYTAIETELQTYTSYYRTTYVDSFDATTDKMLNDTTGLGTRDAYNELKQKMLKSVFENGGFYVGRYEAGIEGSARTAGSTDAPTETAVIKPNTYPYNYITTAQAQAKASGEDFAVEGYQTSLMFGVQWDLVLKYLETKAVEKGTELATIQSELRSDSKNWGNYSNNWWTITNPNSQYLLTSGTKWENTLTYNNNTGKKTANANNLLLTTGSSDSFSKQNIYDFAGNLFEWTLEYSKNTSYPAVYRGGAYNQTGGTTYYAAHRTYSSVSASSNYNIARGFRVALYRDESVETDGSFEEVVADVVNPKWTTENLNVDLDNKQITIDLIGTDKYFEECTLTTDDIKIYVDNTDVSDYSYVRPHLSEPIALTETRTIYGEDVEVQYGVKYTLTINDWVEPLRQTGKEYREWSGHGEIVIDAGTLVDESGNVNEETERFDLTQVDFANPEFTYIYAGTTKDAEPSESPDIDYDDKTVKVVFSVTDKFFEESRLTLEDLKILIDGVEPEWRAEGGTTGVTKELSEPQDVTAVVNGTEKVIGKEYTLLLSNLQQDPNTGIDYSGVITIAIPEGKVEDTSGNKNLYQSITVGVNIPENATTPVLPSTEYTSPYVPTGFSYVEGDLDKGIVIADPNGNEYVWVEVPRKSTSENGPYSETTLAYNLDRLTGDELTAAYTAIETELNTYTAAYKNIPTGTSGYVDAFTSDAHVKNATGMETLAEYTELKQKMLKSVFENGGFYVGRYETGYSYDDSNGFRGSATTPTQTPIIKANAYPYNFVTAAQAQTLASGTNFAVEGYETSLMFGVQWDLMLKYLDTKEEETVTNSVNWGNYNTNWWTATKEGSKYSETPATASKWYDGPHAGKTANKSIMLTTGAHESFKKQNIYDIAGNIQELTLEYSANTSSLVVYRGGQYTQAGATYKASYRSKQAYGTTNVGIGFRVALFKDEEAEKEQVVDVVDPIWELGDLSLETGVVKLRAIDKFFNECTLDINKITIYVGGVEATEIEKEITNVEDIKATVDGVPNTVVGKEYTLKLSNVNLEGEGYTEFTPSNIETDELNLTQPFKYRTENGGQILLKIDAETIKDSSGNVDEGGEFIIGNIDSTKPEVYQYEDFKVQDSSADTETIIFNVTDRNYYPSDLITLDVDKDGNGTLEAEEVEITLWIDETQITAIKKPETAEEQAANRNKVWMELTNKEIQQNLNGVKVVGHQYTLVLSNLAEVARQTGKDYLEWSGTLKVKIAEDAARDLNENTINPDTTTITDFVDVIEPELRYDNSKSVIDKTNRKYTMTFEITDKYYESGELKLIDDVTGEYTNDLTILMQNGQYERNANGSYKLDDDGNRIPKVYNLIDLAKNGEIDLALSATKKYAPTGTKVTDKTTGEVITLTSSTQHLIGHTYSLTVTGLEQIYDLSDTQTSFEIKDGYTTLDYSGIITVTVAQGKITDRQGNGNKATTITSGVTIKDGTTEGTATEVDVVSPVWKYSSSIDVKTNTATLWIEGTDTYFKESTFTTNSIKVIVDGSVVTTGITKTLNSTTILEEDRIENGENKTDVQYGVEYKVTISGFSPDANQIQIQITEGTLEDNSGNKSRKAEFIIYNVLRAQEDVFTGTNTFLGESVDTTVYPEGVTSITAIQRNDIERVEFVGTLKDLREWDSEEEKWIYETGIQRVWDVSAQGDESILAWTSNTEAPYTVYVGSDWEIFANKNSNYLFANIGRAESCTDTETIVNLNLLNTSSATTMNRMFCFTGYKTMTSLTLPSTFDTSNVTDMQYMFNNCGNKSMITLDLGTSFDTSNVTNMDSMFSLTGRNAMVSLNLGQNFNTTLVTNMNSMFFGCGYVAMTSLDLSSGTNATNTTQFNTSNVETMASMFQGCGFTVMTSLNLGTNFNTGKVTDMSYMFSDCGNKAMTSLDLSSGTDVTNTTQFNTSSVTNMDSMFYYCGFSAMTNLNLGNNFDTHSVKDMSCMFNGCGYNAMTSLNLGDKFNTSSVEEMDYMFSECGYKAMTSLVLGELFDTGNVKDMNYMFSECGYTALTSLDLGELFDTSSVTKMGSMFYGCGYNAMTSLKLGELFDTSNVTDMGYMFYGCGYTKMTSLDLGDKFDTSNVTNMIYMFYECGYTAMTRLDLGPAFTNIPKDPIIDEEGNVIVESANKQFVNNLGNSEIIIYAPESIYKNKNAFKLNSTDTTTLSLDVIDDTTDPVTYRGTIIPKYKPEWTHTATIDTTDSTNKKLIITLKGSAYETQPINSDVKINYASDVTSTLQAGDIQVFIDGVDVTNETRPEKVLGAADETTNATSGKKEITHTFTLSNLEEAVRRTGIPYKEWSGNISLKIAGRGQATTTYTKKKLTDEYGNQSMMETDQNGTNADGTWIEIKIDDEDKNKITAKDETVTEITNTTPVYMFSDFIKPEFTYEYANTTIGDGKHGDTKTVTVVFDVTDKYFNSTNLATDTNAELIKVLVDGKLPGDTNGDGTIGDGETLAITKELAQTGKFVLNKETNAVTTQATDYIINESTERKVGERYQLIIRNLEQHDEEGYSTGFDFSGIVTLGFDSGIIDDLSGNKNDGTTITIGKDDPTTGDGHDSGTIVDVVDPVWQIDETELETTGIIKLRAKDKFFSEVSLDEDDITVSVNGTEATNVEKDITSVPRTEIRETVQGVENILVGYEYTLKLNGIIAQEGYTTFEPTNKDELITPTEQFKYRTENGGEVTITIASGTIKDKSGNESVTQDFDLGILDDVKPEVYEVQKIQNPTANTETIIFNVTDKNYDSTDLVQINQDTNSDGVADYSEITLWIDDVQVDSLVQSSTLTQKEIWGVAEGESEAKILGHQYTLIITNIAETTKQEGKDYFEWSGTLKIKVADNAATDISRNSLNTDTTTITDFVDYIKPEIQEVEVINPRDTSAKTYTMSFTVMDKYLDTTDMITENEIAITIDGETATAVAKPTTTAEQEANKDNIWMELTSTPIAKTINKTVSGTVVNGNHTIGHTYTLVLSNFEQSTKQTDKAKDFLEWSGTIDITIAGTAVKDGGPRGNGVTPNGNDSTPIVGGYVDFIAPRIESVSSTKDTTAKTETIIFNVMDKYLNTSDQLQDSEITVYIDGEIFGDIDGNGTLDATEAATVSKVLTKERDFTYEVNGDATHIVGQQYKLVLGSFEQATRNAKQYKDWSGTVEIEIAVNAVTDKGPAGDNVTPNGNAEKSIEGDFVDFIKPDLKYTHSTSNIDKEHKEYTMTFDITDKYYTSRELQLSDLTILMQNGQYQRDANGQYVLDAELKKIPIVYDLKQLADNDEIDIVFTPSAKKAENVKVTNATTGVLETVSSHTIGYTYTLKISGLEQLDIKEGLTTLDYSGIITVYFNKDIITDRSENKNDETTITTGISIQDGVESGTAKEVDVVDPLWEIVSSSTTITDPANASGTKATVTIRGTDSYWNTNGFTKDDLKVLVDGADVTSTITKNLDSTTTLTEDRIVDGEATTGVQYGIEYTISITGFSQTASQVKVQIPKGELVDKTGNDSEETTFILFNVLKSTSSETAETSAFLGESLGTTIYPEGLTEITPIQRQYIEKVEFVGNLEDLREWDSEEEKWIYKTGIQTVWDVSAKGDRTILAWTSQTSAPYTVYIGSDSPIFANQNSSYLFSYIGFAEACTSTTTVSNIDILKTTWVNNMDNMFQFCGYDAMTSLDLGSNFITSGVTTMSNMFSNTGYNAMTSLDLGSNFITSGVTTMSNMFSNTGYNAMTSLDLKDKFDTSNVKNMSSMFENCGYKNMESLDLGLLFNTSSVTNMASMFSSCGYEAMTSLDLGDKFNTSSVQDMSWMFFECGYKLMTSLDLSSGTTNTTQFNTISVTNMEGMFAYCGYTKMTQLKLGNNFNTGSVTNMKSMFNACGYEAMTSLNLGAKFNTSNVRNMESMFSQCGYKLMTSLNLGNEFNTNSVTNMSWMFRECGYQVMTSLDLGDKFDTRNATSMVGMFYKCGFTSMENLDLGAMFTQIPKGTVTYVHPVSEDSVEGNAYDYFMTGCGTENLTIYSPESIYLNRTTFKLNKIGV